MPVRIIEYEVHADAVYPNGMQFGGMQYEDNATEIKYTLSESLKEALGETVVFRIDFSSVSAGYHPSENLNLDGNTVSRTIPLELTAFGGQMQTVFTALTVENGVETTVLSYPTTVYFTPVRKSDVNSDRLTENLSRFELAINEYLNDAKEICDTAKQLAAEAEERVLQTPDALKMLDTKADKQQTANALKGTKGGYGAVALDDVSPVEHVLTAKVSSQNLIKPPSYYSDDLHVHNGIEFIKNLDGTVTVNGTAVSTANFLYQGVTWEKQIPIKRGTYILSGATENTRIVVGIRSSEDDARTTKSTVNGGTLVFTVDNDTTRIDIVVTVDAGKTATNEIAKPQLELGSTATDYTPWVDVSKESLVVLNSNDEREADFTINADGTVDGAKTFYPKTTLTATNDSVYIEAEYNRDINKAFRELLSKVGG